MRQNVDDFIELAGNTKGIKPQPQNMNTIRGETAALAKRKPKGKAVVAIILAAVIALFGVSYYFNLMDTKTKVIQFFISQDDTYQKAMAEVQAAGDAAAKKQAELETLTKQLDQRSADLDTREQALTGKETEAADKQAAEEEKKAEMAKMVTIYEGMDAAVASGILSNYTDKQWIADLLMQMKEKKAAEILAAMDPKLAASLTALMAPR